MYFSKLNLGFLALCLSFPTALAAPRRTISKTSRRDLFGVSLPSGSFGLSWSSSEWLLFCSRSSSESSGSLTVTCGRRRDSPTKLCLVDISSTPDLTSLARGLEFVFLSGRRFSLRAVFFALCTLLHRLRPRFWPSFSFCLGASRSFSSSSELLSGLSAQAFTTTARYLEKHPNKIQLKSNPE